MYIYSLWIYPLFALSIRPIQSTPGQTEARKTIPSIGLCPLCREDLVEKFQSLVRPRRAGVYQIVIFSPIASLSRPALTGNSRWNGHWQICLQCGTCKSLPWPRGRTRPGTWSPSLGNHSYTTSRKHAPMMPINDLLKTGHEMRNDSSPSWQIGKRAEWRGHQTIRALL